MGSRDGAPDGVHAPPAGPPSRRNRRWPHTPRPAPCPTLQAAFSVLIFLLLSSQDGFQTEWKEDDKGVLRAPAIYNGAPARPAAHVPKQHASMPPPQFKLRAAPQPHGE